MADGEVRAQDLAQETASTLSGNEQFVMFDNTAGKRADIDDVATYVAGDKTTLKTTNKTSPVAAINENFDAIADVKEDFTNLAYDANQINRKFKTSFSMNSGATHSSNNDRINVYIEKDTTFKVKTTFVPSASVTTSYFAKYKDGTSVMIKQGYSGSEYKLTALSDIVSIGVYVAAVSSNTSIEFECSINGSINVQVDYLDSLGEYLLKGISKTDLESGSWESNAKASDPRRIRVTNRIPVSKGDVLFFLPKGLYAWFEVYESAESTTKLQNSSWYGGSGGFIKKTIEYDGFMTLMFANGATWATSTTITVNDYVSSTALTQAMLSYAMYDDSASKTIRQEDIEQGTWENNAKINTNLRLRLPQRLLVGENTLFRFVSNNEDLYYLLAIYEDEASTTQLEVSGWLQGEYICTHSGYATVIFANGSTYETSTNITPSDFANEIFYVAPFADVEERTDLETSELYGTPYYSKFVKYNKYMYGDAIVSGIDAPTDFENFVWFTDPHTMYGNYTYDPASRTRGCQRFDQYIEELKFAYESTPTDFVICGGDWIDGGLPDEELFKLSRAEEMCKSNFAPFYNCVGNHDTNYQGRKDAESAIYTTEFTPDCLKDLWFRNRENCYYTFNGKKTKFYVFDTRIENQSMTAENNYLKNQLKWFLNALLSDNSTHIALVMHMYYNTGTSINTFAEYIAQSACAYNARASYSYDGNAYDFSNATGKVEFILAGHSHADFTTSYQYESKTIPVVASINAGNGTGNANSYYGAEHCIFDLINVDYDNGEMNLVRVGNLGSDRTVTLAN